MANLTVQQLTQTPNPTINVDSNQVTQANQGANQTPNQSANQGQQPSW